MSLIHREKMPSIPLNRTNAWEHWRNGRIHATNNDNLGINAPATTVELNDPALQGQLKPASDAFSNIAIKKGLNAIRLFLEYGAPIENATYTNGIKTSTAPQRIELVAADWYKIGITDAQNNAGGAWGDATFLDKETTNSDALATKTRYKDISNQIQNILDQCHKLGLGVIVTGNPFGASLWSANLSKDRYIIDQKVNTQQLQSAFQAFWEAFVKKWGAHPALIGIDPLNEPSG
jgi:hypothetical protein